MNSRRATKIQRDPHWERTANLILATCLCSGLACVVTAPVAAQSTPRCGSAPLTSAQQSAVESSRAAMRSNERAVCTGQVQTIPVFFHVIHDGTTGNVAESVLDDQIAALNDAYGGFTGGEPTRYRFLKAGVTRTKNATFATMAHKSQAERDAKTALHVGDSSTLDLYVTLTTDALGWSSWPWDYDADPVMDGVVIAYQTLPGGPVPFDEGDTAVHEVGHWLGLYHTFAGGCAAPGDEIADTPAEASDAHGCPIGRDTCPSLTGEDPIFNFMDYTDDICMYEFTPNQTTRMNDFFGGERCDAPLAGQWRVSFGGRSLPHLLNSSGYGASVLKVGDFNGDGKDDVLRSGGGHWYVSWSGTGTWVSINNSALATSAMAIGDFNGDGKDDVLGINGGHWSLSSGAASSWQTWNTYSTAMNLLAVGDFNGDGKDDVLAQFNNRWNISYSASGTWQNGASSGVTVADMRIGDFNGDGHDDVLASSSGQWRVSHSATSSWVNYQASALLTSEMRIGDFNGDGKDDVLDTSNGTWRMSNGAQTMWAVVNYNDTDVAAGITGDFNGDGQDDVFLTY